MNVLVNGIGNIGSTLLALLSQYQTELGIQKIYALKNKPMPWHESDLNHFQSIGVTLCSPDDNGPFVSIHKLKEDLHYIFDTQNNGSGVESKEFYQSFPNLVGACAQGSEKAFGSSFMSGINDDEFEDKFAHVVSCNTHSLAAILHLISQGEFSSVNEADFVIVRRSEDLGNHQRLVSANVVARHLDTDIGTHHSIDVRDLFEQVGVNVPMTSSDVTTPSQLMHAVRFNVSIPNSFNEVDFNKMIDQYPFLARTTKFDSNVIFERGRRLGFHGRIYSQAVIVSNNIIFSPDSIKGWAFIPQEGNTLISTLNAFLVQSKSPNTKKAMTTICHDLLSDSW